MAAPDPSVGGTFIWVISTVLFVSLAAGGGCLVLYIIQPDSDYASWLPFVGVALVCLPWLFWMLTCLYRVISRACGVRVAASGGRGGRQGGNGGGGAFDQGGSARANVVNNNNNNNNNNAARVEAPPRIVETLPVRSPESEARRRAQFEAILALDEEDEEEVKDKKKTRSSSNHSSTDLSMASHESEMPLALSMAS
ncbi:uncharacterized protein LOC132165060 [Corylus avellana]|uniref:uncharacterized protein LOC132165060 n=1 Tax=Corylus avellana TaxID=13451 RepID=UPI00286CD4BC|nr:uncharacterized protein LOC132165060 [Corylus avellana]